MPNSSEQQKRQGSPISAPCSERGPFVPPDVGPVLSWAALVSSCRPGSVRWDYLNRERTLNSEHTAAKLGCSWMTYRLFVLAQLELSFLLPPPKKAATSRFSVHLQPHRAAETRIRETETLPASRLSHLLLVPDQLSFTFHPAGCIAAAGDSGKKNKGFHQTRISCHSLPDKFAPGFHFSCDSGILSICMKASHTCSRATGPVSLRVGRFK